jgi:NitT/TauT family transport system substrate-binding protein
MWNRRRTLQTGLATLLSAAAPLRAFSQPKPRVKVRYNEVVRSMLYTPAYVAIAKGYFEELGMDVTLATAQGGDKSVAVMLSNQADIALIGPE